MPREPRRSFVVPTLLAVTTLAAPACSGDDRTTTTGASEATTVATTSASDTGDPTGGPDCAAIGADMDECQATTGCAWDPVLESCVIDCYMLFDAATCVDTDYCEWYGDSCHSPL